MPNLSRTRKRMLLGMVALLVIDVLAIAFLLSPFRSSPDQRKHDLEQAQNDLQLKKQEVKPLLGMEEKLKNADKDLGKFFSDRLPDRQSAIATELARLAQQSNVRISQEKYEPKVSDVPELTEVQIDTSIEGDYISLVKFINALERDKMFFTVKSLQLSNEQQSSNVKLALKTQTFLRNRA
jgi:type IV pilus assembly protein PilO